MKRIFGIIFVIFLMGIIMSPASAAINVSVLEKSQSFITWTWDPGLTITNASIDGYWIRLFDVQATSFTLSDLPANETHTFAIYTATDTGSNTTTTLQDLSPYATATDTFNNWIYVFIVIALFIAGGILHWLFFWFGSGVSLYALMEFINNHPNISTDIWHIQFFIYLALFILGFLLWFLRKRRRY